MLRFAAGIATALGLALITSPSGVDATVSRSSGFVTKKEHVDRSQPAGELDAPPPLLGTLVQTHTDERVPLDDHSPSHGRFELLLADRTTGQRHEIDPRLLELLRSIARKYPGARFEIVSGYRSPKLNEMLRKKGHHVASHSQHSLGHAVDFRVITTPDARGLDPRTLEQDIRGLGWEGGVGVYTLKDDWFVHADVGKLRRWAG